MRLRYALVFCLAFFFVTNLLYASKPKDAKPVSCPALSKSYKIGDRGPAGGFIFYVRGWAHTETGDVADCWQYLEAAPQDLEGRTPWSNVRKGRVGTESGVGYGMSNTRKIVEQRDHKSSAAKRCNDVISKHGGSTFRDWFLPSKDELNHMYRNLKQKNIGGFDNILYWSSSEVNGNYACVQDFDDGNQYGINKGYFDDVRCARAF